MNTKLKFILLFFLIFQIPIANSQEKNALQEIPKNENISVKNVLNKYIDAIGGVEKIKKVKSRVFYYSTFSIVKTKDSKSELKGKMISAIGSNKENVTVVAGDNNNIVSKVVFDGENGATIIPNIINTKFDKKMVDFYKKAIDLFPQITNTSKYSKKVESKKFNSEDCYVLENSLPVYGGGTYKSYEYYSKSSGLLVGSSFKNETTETSTNYKGYTVFDGILTSTLQVSYSKLLSVGGLMVSSAYLEDASYLKDIDKYITGSDSFLKNEISFFTSENKHKNALRNVNLNQLKNFDNSKEEDVISQVEKSEDSKEEDVISSLVDSSLSEKDSLEENLRSRIYRQLKKEKKSSSSVTAISSTITNNVEKFDVQDLVDDSSTSTLKYRRSSLYTLMINDEERERNFVIKNAFGNSEMSEKFNDHNIGPYLIEGTGLDEIKSNVKDKTNIIKQYLEENNVAKELVARWFNRDKEGNFNMKLIADRGQYNASDLNSRIAEGSKRGKALLKDAGEELIGNTFVIVYDFKYTNKAVQAKKRGGFFEIISSAASLAGFDDASLVTDAVNIASDAVGKGYFVRTTSYLYRLVWDEETANKFYNEYWTDKNNSNEDRVKAFGKANFFKMRYVGSEVSRSNLQSTIFTSKSDNALIEISTTKAYDKNIGKLQRTFEEFRVKTPLYKGNPISAKIGLKEGLEKNDKFEVLEQLIDDQGNTTYRRIGKIKVKRGSIWDNTFLAEEATKAENPTVKSEKNEEKPPYTVFTGKKGVYASGMLIRQIN